jgi:hypothetical protein
MHPKAYFGSETAEQVKKSGVAGVQNADTLWRA